MGTKIILDPGEVVVDTEMVSQEEVTEAGAETETLEVSLEETITMDLEEEDLKPSAEIETDMNLYLDDIMNQNTINNATNFCFC